jgi:ABC-type Fe3+ transport system substrate-binding protein
MIRPVSCLAIFLGITAIAVGAHLAPAQAASQPTPVEQLYAELAKLPEAERAKRIEEGARKEGKLSFVHTWRGKLARDHIALFRKRYPFIDVDMSDMGSQDASERLVAEETANRHLTDVVSLAVPDLAEILKADLLANYPTPASQRILAQYKGFLDPEHRWTPWYWSEHGISYNSQLVPADKAPKAWTDICNPAFRNSVSFDPAETRFMVGLYVMLGEQATENLLKCIGENKPIIQRGHTQRMELMLAGDHMVQGDNYLYRGIEIQRENPSAPYAIAYTAPVLGYAGSMVINKNTTRPYAAALLTDWSLSEESQVYTATQLRGPVGVKHPYLPEETKIVTYGDVAADIVDRLQGYWAKYIGRGQ